MKKTLIQHGLPLGLFLLLVLALYGNGVYGGYALQGIDANYSWRQLLQWNIESGATGWWNPYVWMGMGQGMGINTVFFFLALLPMRLEMAAGYITMIFLGMTFMHLFLRSLNIGVCGSVFGAIAFGLAPHFITLTYPAHWDAVHTVGLIPMLFYFLQAGMYRDGSSSRAWICIPVAGAVWGLLMNAEVQRGLYISVMAVAYALFLIFRRPPGSPHSNRQRADGFIRLAAAVLVMLMAFSWNARIQFESELVAGAPGEMEHEGVDAGEERWAFATSWSFHPKELFDSLAPGYHGKISGDPVAPYWGERPVAHSNDGLGFFAAVFGLAAMVLLFRGSWQVRFFTIAAVLSTLLAFGEYWPGRPLFALWYQLPMMDKMRAPVKFLCVTSFAMAILSAYGFQSLLNSMRLKSRAELRKWCLYFGALAFAGVIAFLFTVFNASTLQSVIYDRTGHPLLADNAYATAIQATLWMSGLSVSAFLLTLLSGSRLFGRQCARISGSGFIAVLIISLLYLNGFYIDRTWFEPDKFYEVDPVTAFLKEDNESMGRVAASLKFGQYGRPVPLPLMSEYDEFVTHLSIYHQIPTIENTPQSRIAYDYMDYFGTLLDPPPQLRSLDQLVHSLLDSNIPFWRLSGVKYLLTDGYLYGAGRQPIPVIDALQRHQGLIHRYSGDFRGRTHAIFEIQGALPQFGVFPGVHAVTDRGSMLEAIRSVNFNPLETVILAEDDAEGLIEGREGLQPVQIDLFRPGLVKVSVEVDSESVLLWNSLFDSSWEAVIDGRSAEIFPVNYIMSGVRVSPEDREVKFKYIPSSPLRTLSYATVLIGLMMLPLAVWASRANTTDN